MIPYFLQLSPVKRITNPRYESTYLEDQWETPDIKRAWDDFVAVLEPKENVTRKLLPSANVHSSFKKAENSTFKTDDNSAAHSRKGLPNKPIVTSICFDGKHLEDRDWLSQFENCCSINMWTDKECTKLLPTFLRAQALQFYNDMTPIKKGEFETLVKYKCSIPKG